MDYFNHKSDRLIFRPLTEEDIPSWMEFFENNTGLHFLGITDLELSFETLATNWIQKQLKRYEETGLGQLGVVLKENNTLIGVGGVIKRSIEGKELYEISYSIKPPYWGQGYATEVAKQFKQIGMAVLDAKTFVSIIEHTNIASIKVAKKNGMQLDFKTTFLEMDVDVYAM